MTSSRPACKATPGPEIVTKTKIQHFPEEPTCSWKIYALFFFFLLISEVSFSSDALLDAEC